MSNKHIKTERIRPDEDTVNERLWRGEVTNEELVSLLNKFPPDCKVRIYGNKLQMISPHSDKVYALDSVATA